MSEWRFLAMGLHFVGASDDTECRPWSSRPSALLSLGLEVGTFDGIAARTRVVDSLPEARRSCIEHWYTGSGYGWEAGSPR